MTIEISTTMFQNLSNIISGASQLGAEYKYLSEMRGKIKKR